MSEEQRRNALHDAMAEALESVEKRERESQSADAGAPRDSGAGAKAHDAEPDLSPDEPEADGAEAGEPDVNDRLLRLAADFDNYRKRSRRELEDARRFGIEHMLRDLLPVIDNLQRAISAEVGAVANDVGDAEAKPQPPLLEGIRMVHKQFSDVLDQHGVRAFESVGSVFDPELHEALSQAPSDEHAPGSVIAEHERGYMIHDRLLRPARVVVAMPKAEEASPDEKKPEETGPSDPLESDDG